MDGRPRGGAPRKGQRFAFIDQFRGLVGVMMVLGHANYYFNELNRDRVWNALVKHGDFKAAGGNWELSGNLGDDSPEVPPSRPIS